ncbi:DUF3099 domain-containing protein [Streptomyces sp. NPDC006393]|uniref:DUF3099 domain-containing protein n=1 Tax=Streptomyces sp. NPDC006393 TaxID=3156763 RepID=UPI0033F03D07
MRKQHGGGHVQVFRITGARTGLQEDVRGRQRRYVISMSIRTVSVLLAVALWNVERYVAIVALVLGLVLPYIAVVIANAGRENAPNLPSTFVTMPTKPMITAPRTEEDGFAESGARDTTADPAAGAANGTPQGTPGTPHGTPGSATGAAGEPHDGV